MINWKTVSAVASFLLICAVPAQAQYGARRTSNPATGETYHVEATAGYWNPTPEIFASSEQLGILGTDINFVDDFGITQTRFGDLRFVLRPARKHKFRIQYTPIKYSAESIITREIVFNGIRYRVGLPVNAGLTWKSWRFGYEFDFISRDRGFAGLIVEAKYTDVEVSLANPFAAEFARAKAPIPAIGGIGRVYVTSNVAATFEMTGFKLPDGIDPEYQAQYVDWDLYGTINFTDNFGAQVGYRSMNVIYRVEADRGDFDLRGLYFAATARF